MGPEPMMQIEWRSSRRGTQGHLLDPALEHRPRVMGSRPRFGMELHRACAFVRELESFDGAVVERDVRRLARVGRLDRETVVLRGHEHPAGHALEDGVVRTAVAERKLVGAVTCREREQLVPETNAEY